MVKLLKTNRKRKRKNHRFLYNTQKKYTENLMKKSTKNNSYTDKELIAMFKAILKENPEIVPNNLTKEEKTELTLKVENRFSIIVADYEAEEALFSITSTEVEDRKLLFENVT